MATTVKHHGVMPYIIPSDFVWGALPVSSFEPIAAARLENVTVINETKIRLNFASPMKKNSALSDIANYTLTANVGGIADLIFTEITIPADANPTYVEIEISEMTNGGDYNCEVSTTLQDADDNFISDLFKDVDFIGVGVAPTVSTVVADSSTTVDVTFSEPMLDNADIRNTAKYTFDNDLIVEEVIGIEGAIVSLRTSEQTPGLVYTLTVMP